MPTIEQIYYETIKSRSASDRLRLAQLILNDMSAEAIIDDRDDWNEEDLRDATRYSLRQEKISGMTMPLLTVGRSSRPSWR